MVVIRFMPKNIAIGEGGMVVIQFELARKYESCLFMVIKDAWERFLGMKKEL